MAPATAGALTPGSRPLDSAPGVLVGELADEQVGASLAIPGDLDGDGVPDLVVGAPGASDGAGRVYVISGADIVASRFVSLRDVAVVLEGEAASSFGAEVAAAGDTNGDGWPDFLIGAPSFFTSAPDTPEGAAYLFLGGPDALAELDERGDAVLVLRGPHPGAQLGAVVAGVGDANGDGLDDFGVTIRSEDALGGTGSLAVVPGRDETSWGLGPSVGGLAGWTWDLDGLGSPAVGIDLGGHFVAAGDVDGDGREDLWIGLPGRSGTFLEGGALLLVPGRDADGDLLDPDDESLQSRAGDEVQARFGAPLRRSWLDGGDLLWVGAAGATTPGRALLLDPADLAAAPLTTLVAPDVGPVAVLDADLEGDGRAGPAALQASATGQGIGAEGAGRVSVFAASRPGEVLTEAADAIFFGEGGWGGGRSAAAGNLDGDAYDDLLVGAPGALSTGAVFVLRGGELADGDGFSPLEGDCDDTSAAVHPAAEEDCDDGLDNDCNGFADGIDAPCALDGSGLVAECSAAGGSGPTGLAWLVVAAGGLLLRRRRSAGRALIPALLLTVALTGCPPGLGDDAPTITIVSPEDDARLVGLVLPVEVAVTGGRLAPEKIGQPPDDPDRAEFLWSLTVDGQPRGIGGGPLQLVDELRPGVHNIEVELLNAETQAPLDPPVTQEISIDLLASEPTVELVAPEEGAFVAPGGFEVRLDIRGFTLDGGAVGLVNQPGIGHAHLLVDDVIVAEVASRELITPALAEGDVVLSVELVENDHSPLPMPATDSVAVSIRQPMLEIQTPVQDETVATGPAVDITYDVVGFSLDPDDVNSPNAEVPPGVGHVHIYLNGAYQGLDATGGFTLPAVNGCSHTLFMVLALANHEELFDSWDEVDFSLTPCVAIETPLDGGSGGPNVTLQFGTPGFPLDPLGADNLPDGRHTHVYVDDVFEAFAVTGEVELSGLALGDRTLEVRLAEGDHDIADPAADELSPEASDSVTIDVLP